MIKPGIIQFRKDYPWVSKRKALKVLELVEEEAFTLVEVMVVLIILGGLAALGIPQYQRNVKKMQMQEGVQVLHAIRQAQLHYRLDNGAYTAAMGDLDITIPALKYFGVISLGTAAGAYSIVCGSTTFYYLADIQGPGGVGNLAINPEGDILCTPCNDFNRCGKYGFKIDW